MKYTDLITIAMPVYERKEYFLEALDSAINQTIKCRIIVVDNNSSHDFFKTTCKQKGIKYYKNERNIGMAGNFERCIELAESEYVTTLQDDDKLSPIYVESFLDAITKHPDVDVFFSNFVKNIGGSKYPHSHILPYGYMKDGKKIIEYAIKYKLGFPYMCSSIKKTIFSGFYKEYAGSYDWLWIYSNADRFTFYGDSRALYEFREHELQDTRNNSLKYCFSLPYLYDVILKEKAPNRKLERRASIHAFWELICFKSMATKDTIKEFAKNESLYGIYFVRKLSNNIFIRIIYALPKGAVYFAYRVFRKLGFTS
ncbi:glycosyltransferase family 2 protein [Draconibacterium orientale]|uniref:glycosyltransferase family 2 protein n=1 Tax=Draconibacterium orientale TaxID=1168034 RepID=UPI0029C02B58|nr:glycosyltransferase family 2 protein [Draconibacterium orientale]